MATRCPAEHIQTCSDQRTANTSVNTMANFPENTLQKRPGVPCPGCIPVLAASRQGLPCAAAGAALALSKSRCVRDDPGGRRWQRHKTLRLERGAGKVSSWTDSSLSLVATLFISRCWVCSLRHSLCLGWETAARQELPPRGVVGGTAEAVPAPGLTVSAPGQAHPEQPDLRGWFWGIRGRAQLSPLRLLLPAWRAPGERDPRWGQLSP